MQLFPKRMLRPVNGKAAAATALSFRDQPGLRGLGPRDPVKPDGNRLEFRFIGGLLYGFSLLHILCCPLSLPCPAPLPFSQASYFLKI